MTHDFLFTPGHWSGEGKISLQMVEEEFPFQIRWVVPAGAAEGKIQCSQEIQIQTITENMCNTMIFYNIDGGSFSIDMENPNVGRVSGKGVYDPNMIGWEFRGGTDNHFEGFETYYRQEDGSYKMHGEYVTSDQFRTHIEAHLYRT